VDVAPASTTTWQWLRSSTTLSGATGGTYTVTDADLGSALAVIQTETNFLGSASATSANTDVVQPFDPNALFRYSEPGVWFDPNDIGTLYKGPTTVGQVTSPGDTVYMMLDKSKGLVLGPELVVNGNFSGGVANWTGAGSPTLSVVDGELEVTRTATGYYAFQDFTTVVGRTYVLTGTVRSAATNSVAQSGRITLSSPTVGSVVDSNGVTKQVNFTFIATVTTTQVTLGVASGGATGATGDKAYFDNISVKEVPGNHATQATPASQPTYGIVPAGGRRNLLLQTEQWGVAPWGHILGAVVTANAGVAPNGTTTADRITFPNQYAVQMQSAPTVAGVSYTFSFYAKHETGNTSLAIFHDASASGNTTPVVVTSTWQRFSVTVLGNAASGTVTFGLQDRNASGFGSTLVWGAQVELGSLMTDYQRVTTEYDVTEAGVPSLGYLQFNGVNNGMITGTITPGTDKVQSFAGVRKNTDSLGVVAELGPIVNTTFGTFFLGTYTGQAFGSSGTTYRDALFTPVANPNTSVLTGLGDISGDRATLRANGVQIAQNTGDQGTGNYNSYVLNIGRRDNSAVAALNGQLFPLIVRFGSNLTAARITSTENWMASQTPLQWTVGAGFWNDAYPWSDISAWRD
jgi:hypothetical protein